uniref:DNA-directed DNA/RNA polymerase mu-like n=1 Tax=Phallusia mammillata TaxID=59560 RepID=A0A6F9DPQ0_9ASCI|nr:DNA-directed DNA/RNA polymerase mu-like [Phallusia mammillata]
MSSKQLDSVYFVERRLYKARIDHFSKLAKTKRLFSIGADAKDAKYLVAQDSSGNEVLEYLQKQHNVDPTVVKEKLIVDVSWFIDCMKSNSVIPIEQKYVLQIKCDGKKIENEPPTKKSRLSKGVNMYACQNCTPLHHFNSRLTDALEILEQHAFFRLDQNAESRALAFRRGSATLKACPHKITSVDSLKNLPYIDTSNSSKAGHCKKVITEILEEGFSDEVEDIVNSDFYKTMKLFCGIWGVGPSTAKKWFDSGHRHLNDIKNLKLNKDQTVGLEYYEDLNTPVSKDEALCVSEIVKTVCMEIKKDLLVTLVGGFRRGKPAGHDVDLLISHPTQGEEKHVLPKVMEKLKDNFLYTDKKMSSGTTHPQYTGKSSTMDQFEKCFSIFKLDLPKSTKNGNEKPWKAIRVDLIVVPTDQYPFALLGWTGTKHFEREIRRYTKTEKKVVLTSHGMYTTDTKQSIEAKTEEEIFKKLDLEFRPPSERCC